jgi:hypothetical protein
MEVKPASLENNSAMLTLFGRRAFISACRGQGNIVSRAVRKQTGGNCMKQMLMILIF